MKYSAAVAVMAATGAYAQLSVIQGVLSKVSDGIDSLNTAASAFNGDVEAVKSKADDLNSIIKKGTDTIKGSNDLELSDALGLTDPVQSLTKKGQNLADNFKARRSDVEKANACGLVRQELNDINTNSGELIDATVSKVPKAAQSIAESLASGLTKVLQQAQSDFSESNCKDSGEAPSSKTSAAPSSSAAASSSSPVASSPVATSTAAAHSSAAGGAPSSKSSTLSSVASSAPTSWAPNTTAVPTSHNGTSGLPPSVTAGAALLAPAGALAMAVAAAIL